MNKRFSTSCVVLKNLNYRDMDKLYTLFSPDYGKFNARAAGVRKLSSRRLGSLDTLNHVSIEFSESSQGIKTITQAQIISSYKEMKGTISGIAKGLYIAELVHRFFYQDTHKHESSGEVFQLLIGSLNSFNKFYSKYQEGSYNFVPIRMMNMFEIKLMQTLGYEMSLDSFLLNKLEMSKEEIEYLQTLKVGTGFENINLVKSTYSEADEVIKEYVLEVLDERVYSPRLF